MSYLSDLRESKDNPHLADYSDEEIISALPKIDPHKFAGMTPDEVKFVATNDEWQITKGFKAGIDQTQALGGGLVAAVGDAIGAEGLKQEGLDIYESNMSEAGLRSGNVAGFTDIEGIEDTLDWASYTLGNLVPSVATVVGTGGIGGAVAKIGGKKLVNNLVEKELGKGVSLEIAKQTAGKELAKRIATGTAAGSYAGGVGLGTGSVYGDTGDAGISLIHGLFIGGLDALPILRAMGRSASGASREAAVSSVKAEMAKQGVYEGATEAAQNFVEQHARYMSENDGASLLGNLGETNVKELIDNAAAGALGGSAMGGGIGLARRNRQTPEEAQQTEETTQDNEFPTIDLRQPTEQAPSSGITEQEYYAALEVPFVSRNEEQDAIIFNYRNNQINNIDNTDTQVETPTVAPTVAPMDIASANVEAAGQEAAVAGGDALDVATAQGEAIAQQTPNAVRETGKQAANNRAQESNRSMEGIDGLIISARRLGFYDEEIRLNAAKKQLERAVQLQQNGDLKGAQRLQQRADATIQDILSSPAPQQAPDALDGVSSNLPANYSFEGDVSSSLPAASNVQQQAQDQGQVFDVSPLPEAESNQQAQIGNDSVAYGEEPSNPPRETAQEGAYFANGEMEAAAEFRRSSIPNQPQLENRSFPQLETENAIYIGQDAQAPQQAQNQDYTPEGIGQNIINRMASLPTSIKYKPTVTIAEFEALQNVYRRVIRTPVRSRTDDDVAITQIYNSVKSGEITIDDTVTTQQPVTQEMPAPAQKAETSESQKVTDNSTAETPISRTKQNETKTTTQPAEKIEDFGEVIQGAKKHTYTLSETLKSNIDVSTVPLSKSFPKPDYEKLVASGVKPERAAYVAMIRERLGVKPRNRYKLDRWSTNATTARKVADSVLNTDHPISEITSDRLKHDVDIANLANEILPSQIGDLAKFQIEANLFSLYKDEKNVTKHTVKNLDTRRKSHFDSLEEALAYVKNQVTTVDNKGKALAKFDIWTEGRRGSSKYFVGKKIASNKYIELHKADTLKEAREYIKENNEQLVEQLKEKKKVKAHRRPTNNPRIGEDYRDGENITPEAFAEAFGFRGVQFGNWVEDGKRQEDLNNAFDGLNDLASILNIPTQALSFNGELGLAFGARGKAGAAAHYESGTVVINLTKKNGAGSLAHEWFHALDNYFGKKDNQGEFITENTRPTRVRKNVDGRDSIVKSTDADFNTRREVYDAFKSIQAAVETKTDLQERSEKLDARRAKNYWSTTVEMTARSFEQYVISKLAKKDQESDYLANVMEEPTVQADKAEYPYPLQSEMNVIESAYDGLFDTLKTQVTESGTALYSLDDNATPAINETEDNQFLTLEETKESVSETSRKLKLRGVSIEVVENETGLPQQLQDQIKEDGAQGHVAALYHQNIIYILSSKMTSIQKVEESMLHEAAHFGGAKLFGSDLTKAYNKLALKLGGTKGIKAKADEYGISMEQYFEAADNARKNGEMNAGQVNEYLIDEFLAHISGDKAYKNLPTRVKNAVQEFIGRVRDILRKLGVVELSEVSNSDIAYLLKKLGDAAQGQDKFSDRPHFLNTTDADINEIIEASIPANTRYSRDKKARYSLSMPVQDTGFAIPVETLASTAIRKMADKFKPLKDIQKAITDSGASISEEADAYAYEELFHGKAEQDLKEMRDQYVEPLAKQMAEFDISQADLDAYLYARHAPERNAHIAEINPELQEAGSGMTNAEAETIIQDVAATGKQSQYDQLAATVYDIGKAQRDLIKNYGLEDSNIVDSWESKYNFYVPLKGFAANETENGRPVASKGFSIGGSESRRAMGRKSKAGSPSSYTIQGLTEKIVRKRKNEVAQAFLKLVEQNPNKSYWQVFTNENPEMSQSIVKKKDPETGEMVEQVVERAVPMAMFSDRYFTAKRDGETYYIKLEDQLLFNAMKNIGPEAHGPLISTLSKVNRVLSSLNTSYNPEFAITNFARDIQTAFLNLEAEQSRDDGKIKGEKIAAKALKDIPLALKASYRGLRGKSDANNEWDQYYKEFVKAGGKTGFFDMKDIKEQGKEIESLISIANGGVVGGTLKWFRASTKLVDDANGAVENAIRLSAYRNAREAGISKQKAASLAKNMTVNFNRRGELGTTLNALYMFANASIQGSMNFARTMIGLKGERGDPAWSRLNTAQKVSIAMMGGAYALGMLNRSIAGEDDDGENFYDKVPDYIKERNIVIMKSMFGGEEGEYWNIPLAYGYNIFHVFGTSTEAMIGGGKPVMEEATKIALAAAGSFSPIGFQHSEDGSAMVLKNVAPTLLKPFVDLGVNENFMGGTIYNENFPFGTPKPDSAMSRRSTPQYYKDIAEFMNDATGGSRYQPGGIDIAPETMQYFVKYFTGGFGNFAVNKLPDNLQRWFTDAELETHKTLFLGRVNGKVLPYADMDKFYKRRDEIGQIDEEKKSLKGRERFDFVAKNKGKLRLKELVKQTEKKLKAQRKIKNRIYEEDLTLKQRDDKLKAIELRMKRVIDNFNLRYKKASE